MAISANDPATSNSQRLRALPSSFVASASGDSVSLLMLLPLSMPRIRSMQDRDRSRRVTERTAGVAVRIVVRGTHGPQNTCTGPDRSLLDSPRFGIHKERSCGDDADEVHQRLP